jgi:hypothetical protein
MIRPDIGLLIAFIIFAVIDLTFVGTTTFFLVKLVKKLLNEKTILDEIVKLLKKIRREK